MKLAVCLLMFLMLVGCALKQPSSSPIQKERVELDSGTLLTYRYGQKARSWILKTLRQDHFPRNYWTYSLRLKADDLCFVFINKGNVTNWAKRYVRMG